eukprot:Amastigsp_a2395_132.p1 type:complete len:161 gc:universal Amastigsp_a2395_132:354-836(+)
MPFESSGPSSSAWARQQAPALPSPPGAETPAHCTMAFACFTSSPLMGSSSELDGNVLDSVLHIENESADRLAPCDECELGKEWLVGEKHRVERPAETDEEKNLAKRAQDTMEYCPDNRKDQIRHRRSPENERIPEHRGNKSLLLSKMPGRGFPWEDGHNY